MYIIFFFFLSLGCWACGASQDTSQSVSNNQITIKTETFKVWGNCDMCKKTIETAAKIKGVSKANWDGDKQLVTVSYDEKQATIDQIHQKIAQAGYDTDKQKGNDKAYAALPACCQYERQK